MIYLFASFQLCLFSFQMSCSYNTLVITLENILLSCAGVYISRQIFDQIPVLQAIICGATGLVAPILSYLDDKHILCFVGIVLEIIFAILMSLGFNKRNQVYFRITQIAFGISNIIIGLLNQFLNTRTKNCIIQYFHPIVLMIGFHYLALQINYAIQLEIRKNKYLKQLKIFPKQVIQNYQQYSKLTPQIDQFKYNKFQLPSIEQEGINFCIKQVKITKQLIQFKDDLYLYKANKLICQQKEKSDEAFEPMATMVYKQSADDIDYFEKYLQIAKLFVQAYCKPKVVFIIEVPRIAVLISVARKLQQTPIENHCYQLYCKFQGEKGADLSGLTKEMFSIMDKELFDLDQQDIQSIKQYNEQKVKQQEVSTKITAYSKQRSLIISDNNSIMISQYINPYYAYTIGWYLGKALFQNITVNSNITMNAPITIQDVFEYDEYFGRFLRQAQEYKESLYTLVDLLPGLKYKVKEIYSFDIRQAVELHYFGEQILSLIKLKQGFDSVFPRENIYFLNPQFVCKKIKAQPFIDVYDWEKYTVVNKFPKGCTVVQDFWQLMHEDQQLAQQVLQFATALKYAPYGGFKTLGDQYAFSSQYFNIQPTNPENFPSSQTCTNTLRLPCINDINELKRRLLNSLQYQSIENP